ncbi:DUF3795 domain-containing protein [Desulfosporosinus sp.]|uniref:DUF3795 domain-containing protein n=1 Tax=Desulfosporosinus sp. TaxID=157907 RepID=UPI002319DC42|nr:DUF3795 domain-containing protein [Desulfosporosinus sp.]MCO5387512.1 DUF3795 domain-containing protein [Desulfosporosinus sp.]MDA8220965.1 DUF3795 domain-containing protein [Desulfitobacterium hafniense]
MEEYIRKYPEFSLCGLNCSLCSRFHTDGPSRCPGCGGTDFLLKHPTCAIITCNKKHDNVEFCFECSVYPCKRYQGPSKRDSFISYKNVLDDQGNAKINLQSYLNDLKKKQEHLAELIANYNSGRSKGFYCLAVNLLPISAVDSLMEKIRNNERISEVNIKEKAQEVTGLIKAEASALNIELVLRK